MDTTSLVLVIVGLLLIAVAVAWFIGNQQRSRRLQERFGPEYERTVEDVGTRRSAEDELEARAERVARLDLRQLAVPERDAYERRWRAVQARFVDEPRAAVAEADTLVGEVMDARGYPVADFEQRAADVSVDHADVVSHYRAAHGIVAADGAASTDTEGLRQAFVHYRALFADLLETDSQPADGAGAAAEADVDDHTSASRRP